MNDLPLHPTMTDSIEGVLSGDLAQADALIGTIVPIMRHLVANEDQSVFSEEIVARTRSMIADVARQLMVAVRTAAGADDTHELLAEDYEGLCAALGADSTLLAHVHSQALEWQLTERLHGRLALDPVLSPLLQALIASSDAATSSSAMNLLAAQARFVQSQRRMQLALAELPADHLHAALVAAGRHFGPDEQAFRSAEQAICESYDESRSRLGLMSRLVLGMGAGAHVALSIEHAGIGMFTTALGIAIGQDRALTVLSTNEGQVARLALSLAAAGLKPKAVKEQFFTLHPDIALPTDFDQLGADRAAAILAHGTGYPG